MRQLYNQPIVTTLSSFSQVANLVRNPYGLKNKSNLEGETFLRHDSGGNISISSQRRNVSRSSENLSSKIPNIKHKNRHSLTPIDEPVLQEMDTFAVHHNHNYHHHHHNHNHQSNQQQTHQQRRHVTQQPRQHNQSVVKQDHHHHKHNHHHHHHHNHNYHLHHHTHANHLHSQHGNHHHRHHQTKHVSSSLPPIECSNKRSRLAPLTIEEYESRYRESATDLELIERVFAGSMACNQLRAALWPYLFGLILHRGRFERVRAPDPVVAAGAARGQHQQEGENFVYKFVEHEANYSRWRELKSLYETYQAQWKAILPEQELRFSTYRERKSLIETDVIRCDRLHPFFAEEPQNLSSLTDMLMTYMMYDFDIGYVQGMSDIAGPILYMYNGDIVKSFWVFVEVMKLFRRNFEPTQKTIHFQLSCLYGLIQNTDPIFAKYLEENDSSNCFFAFRAIVCQFKRELMKDYSKVLFLWDTIWCVARRAALEDEMNKLTNSLDSTELNSNNNNTCDSNGGQQKSKLDQSGESDGSSSSSSSSSMSAVDSQTSTKTYQRTMNNNTNGPLDSSPYSSASSTDSNQADSLRHKLKETEIFVLSLCLSMIRRERDSILASKLDSTDIHLHFIDPKLAADMNSFIEHAINIYSYLKYDCDLSKVIAPPSPTSTLGPTSTSNGCNGTNATQTNGVMVPANGAKQTNGVVRDDDISRVSSDDDDYDSLSDFLIINGVSGT